ncbi:hypothetical protein DAEQUDRAFT_645421, partial [Daedalea quercina L-15889]
INGLQALVLLDSGSTTDSISPDFARVAGIAAFELENPAILQLGCVGSRSRINYGANVPVLWGTFRGEVYFDVVNLDRYDAVLGTPFMRKFGVCLDFSQSVIRIGQHAIPALLPQEEEDAANHNEARITQMRERLMHEYANLFGPVPPGLPPVREVNHRIPLIDENKRYTYYLPKCADSLKPKLLEKIQLYTANGWWKECQTEQAAPMLCIAKKDGG